MSISSQPFTRQASLQRSRSTVLASAALDALFEPKGSHTLQQPLYPNPQAKKPCLSGISPLQQVCESTTALLTQQDAGLDLAKQCAKPAALSLQCPSGNPDAVLKQGSGLLPALASKIAEQLQTKRNGVQANPSSSSSGPAEQSFSVQLPSVSANPESTVTYKLHQNSAVSNSVQVSDAFAAAMADAAQLTAEISSFKAGQSAGREKTHLAAAARQTAHTLQELAQQQLLQAFTEALHHVSQSTLITQVMQLLPLPSYSQQLAHPDPLSTSQLRVTLPRPSARQAQDSTLDQPLDSRKSSMADPLAMLHLKKRRSQRPTRPASAGIPGMQTRFSICARQSGYPSESSDEDQAPISQEEADQIGGMQMGMKQWELGQHNCSKQDWSQLDWSKQLPASTSALLQAVEMAAAAERPGRVCPVTGKKVLRRPRSALATTSSTCDHSLPCMPAKLGKPSWSAVRQLSQRDSECRQFAAAEQLAQLSQANANTTDDTFQASNDGPAQRREYANNCLAPDLAPAALVSSGMQGQSSLPGRAKSSPAAGPVHRDAQAAASPSHQTVSMPCNLPEPAPVSTALPNSVTVPYGQKHAIAADSGTVHNPELAATHAAGQTLLPAAVSATGATSLAGLPIALAPSSLIRRAGSPGLRQSMWQHLHSLPPGMDPPLQSPFAAVATLPFSFQAPPHPLPPHPDPFTYATSRGQATAPAQPHSHGQPQTGFLQPPAHLRHTLNGAAASANTLHHPVMPGALQPQPHCSSSQASCQHSKPGKTQHYSVQLEAMPTTSDTFATSLARPQTADATAEASLTHGTASTAARSAGTAQARCQPQSAHVSAAACNASMPAASAFNMSHALPDSAGLSHANLPQTVLVSTVPEAMASSQAKPIDSSRAFSHAPGVTQSQAAGCALEARCEDEVKHSSSNRLHHAEGAAFSAKAGSGARLPLSPSAVRCNGQASTLHPVGNAVTAVSSGKKRSYSAMQHPAGDMLAGVGMNELLPGRNVVLDAGHKDDLAFQVLPNRWCWVARIDKLTATHMKVSWYGRHHGRCTLARHTSGPDEGQVRSGEVDLTQHEPLAVFDRFSGNKEVPPVVYTHAIAKLSMQVGNKRLDQENATHC